MSKINLLLYHDLVLSIVAALDAKDSYTANHSLRVADMTEQLCEIMNLPSSEIVKIHMAAHVHDIGKIGVPDYILSKPDRLNAEEWAMMMEHPLIGANILNKSHGLAEISNMVLHHHERWNGKGYPDGLRGEGIPLGARIITVCDSIDAMMSHRSYRSQSLTAEQCRYELQKNKYIMYDAEILEPTLKNWGKIIGVVNFSDTV